MLIGREVVWLCKGLNEINEMRDGEWLLLVSLLLSLLQFFLWKALINSGVFILLVGSQELWEAEYPFQQT